MEGMEGILMILAILLVLVGIAGTILPALPGTPLVFLGLLVAAWAEGFDKVGWFTLVVLALLTILSIGVDFLSSTYGAKRVGASWWAVTGALVGTVLGLFFGIPGLILGPFVGAVLGEYLTRRDWVQARKAGFGAWLGFILGTAGKLALTFAMLGIFVLAYVM